MSRYAKDTEVSVERSRAEIETTLNRYGADTFAYMQQPGHAAIGFRIGGRQIRFVLPLPEREAFRTYEVRTANQFGATGTGKKMRRDDEAVYRAWEQACRQRWRALALAIKAKLEAVESGIASFEDEFLAYVVLPGGETVGDWARPQLARALSEGRPLPPLLPPPCDA